MWCGYPLSKEKQRIFALNETTEHPGKEKIVSTEKCFPESASQPLSFLVPKTSGPLPAGEAKFGINLPGYGDV